LTKLVVYRTNSDYLIGAPSASEFSATLGDWMKLSELRRLAIRKQLRVHFALPNGTDCLITEGGLAQVPSLKQVPDFNLEEALGQVQSFRVEAVGTGKPEKVQTTSREQLQQMIVSLSPAAAVAAHDHDD